MNGLGIKNSKIQLTILLKVYQLQKKGLNNIEAENVESYLQHVKWNRKQPETLHEAVNDVLSIDADNIVRYLSTRAIIDSRNKKLSDFKNLLEGE